ncbi:GNAT family N-acetyltransferase [Inhella proteolytica]|uniref:GNAT family N-acetyltransferase n=1 Tax=Inhella proteolytica TaxID=2795029 RepID=A0A931J4V7_9BURK|nr:GNAT family N-acetyltransferase [Inhella proteolytica]MBH9578306.1 GNAT family N-acetyltransferase [Inhella proteolytica]
MQPQAPLTLDTPRLRLRPFTGADLDAFAAMSADAEVMRFIGDGSVIDRAMSWRALAGMLGHWALRGYGQWAIERKSDGLLLGRTGFIDPEGWPGFELGWLLGHAHWGQGYAFEATQAALREAPALQQGRPLISLIRPANEPSIRLAERLGARRTGELELLGGPCWVYTHA